MNKKIAVILSGCGFKDGAEIREAVLTLLALDSLEAEVKVLAPNIDQHHTTDHLTGEQSEGSRNVLVESSRIARGEIDDLESANASDFDGVILPGGFGAATNLSTFAFDGQNGKVTSSVSKFLKEMFSTKKPIGAICIAPALIALLSGKNAI